MSSSEKNRRLWKFAIIFLIIIIFPTLTQTQNKDVVINSFAHKVHRKDYFKYLNITEQIKDQRKSIHIEVEFAKTVFQFDVQLTLSKYREKSGPLPLFSGNIEGCQILSNKVKNRIFKVVTSSIQYGETTFPTSCPLRANKHYVIDQLYMHPEDFPYVGRGLRILANCSWNVQRKPVFSIFLDVSTK